MKKAVYTLLIIFTLFKSNSQTPGFMWAKSYLGSYAQGLSITSDAAGNVYCAGIYSATVDFDPGAGTFNLTSNGGYDMFISKLDANGNFIWAVSVGGSVAYDGPNSVKVDGAGNVYTTGNFNGTVDFDPGAGIFNLTSAGAGDIFVLKLNSAGNFVWAKAMGGTSTNDVGHSIAIDAAGNVYSVGNFGNTVDFDPGPGTYTVTSNGSDDIYISKLDVNGNFVWAKTVGGIGSDDGASLVLDGSSNVYVTGDFNNTVDFDPNAGVFNMTSGGSNDAYILKLDASGNFVFAKQFSGIGAGNGESITLDNSGNILTTGSYSGTADFDPGAGTFNLTSVTGFDIIVSKLDASGNFVWAKSMGGTGTETGLSIDVDGNDDVLTTGYFGATADFDPNVGISNLSPSGGTDIFVSKLSSIGNYLWAVSFGSASNERGESVNFDIGGNVLATGYFYNTIDFNPGPGTYTMATAFTSPYVLKLANCTGAPSSPGSISGSVSLCVGNPALTYSVSIVAGATSYSWNLPAGWTGSSTTNSISATPGTSGIFSVSASNFCGTSSISVLNVTVNPLPTINASSTTTMLCSGQSATITASGASTYTFNPGGTAASIVVSPTVNSTYTISGTDANGCQNSSTFTQSVTVCSGIETISNSDKQVILYPNPNTGIFTLRSNGNFPAYVYNLVGQLILTTDITKGENIIDISSFNSGLYFIRANSMIIKVIKE